MALDAGTRSDSAERAYQDLRRHAPGLPPLTRVLITHSHWDHIHGLPFFTPLFIRGSRVRLHPEPGHLHFFGTDGHRFS